MSLAYLDPGSGSLIASALVGGAAAAGVAVKSARAKFTGAFSRKRRAGAEPETSEAAEAADTADAVAAADPADTVDARDARDGAEVSETAASES